MKFILICTLICIFSGLTQSSEEAKLRYARARIESCPGCSLNRLHEVKKFIYDDLPNYKNVEFKKIHGAPPELVLLDNSDSEVERLKLGHLNRQECNDLLKSKGFQLKDPAEAENHAKREL